MANILITFFNGITDEKNPDAIPMFYEGFINRLDKEGNEILAIPHRLFGVDFPEIDQETQKMIIGFKPDICFVFNNAFFDLCDIVDCPIVIYEVDSPRYFANKQMIRKHPDRYLYFVIQTASREVLRKDFGVKDEHVFYVPLYTEIYADEMQQTANISFVGSKFTKNEGDLFIEFMQSNPTREEKEMFLSCIDEIAQKPQITPEELVYKCRVTSELVARKLAIPSILMALSGEKRIKVLSAVADLGLELYGTKNWGSDYYCDLRLNLSYNNKNVYSIRDNQEILNASKIGISVAHLQATSGFPWRVMDIMASKACLVTDYHSDFEKLFPEVMKVLPVYETPHEAREICQKLLKEEGMRIEIVQRCNEVVDKKYRFVHLLQKMEEYSGIKMHT